jgi:hypothetical protein
LGRFIGTAEKRPLIRISKSLASYQGIAFGHAIVAVKSENSILMRTAAGAEVRVQGRNFYRSAEALRHPKNLLSKTLLS